MAREEYGKRRENPERDFQRKLRRLKKDFQKEVLPAVKRKRYHLSKSELAREKARKAERRRKRQLRKAMQR